MLLAKQCRVVGKGEILTGGKRMAYLQFIFVVLFGRLSQAGEIPCMNSPCDLFVFLRDENKERFDEFVQRVDLALGKVQKCPVFLPKRPKMPGLF